VFLELSLPQEEETELYVIHFLWRLPSPRQPDWNYSSSIHGVQSGRNSDPFV